MLKMAVVVYRINSKTSIIQMALVCSLIVITKMNNCQYDNYRDWLRNRINIWLMNFLIMNLWKIMITISICLGKR